MQTNPQPLTVLPTPQSQPSPQNPSSPSTHQPLTPLLQDTSILDARPYIQDEHRLQNLASTIDAMILKESGNISRGVDHYLEMVSRYVYSGNDDIFVKNPLAKSELEKVDNGKISQGLDLDRYQVKGKGDEKMKQGDWEGASQQVAVVAEVHRRAAEQLELLQRFGPASWKTANSQLETSLEIVKRLREEVDQKVAQVNEERKAAQTQTGQQLATLQAKYESLVRENAKIDRACSDLEQKNMSPKT